MKRITLAIWVLFLSLCIVGGAMAAPSTKPHAEMCFMLHPSLSLRMTLVINPTGAVKMADGSTPFYAINGVLYNTDNTSPMVATISGTGYLQKLPGDSDAEFPFVNILFFSMSGSTFLMHPVNVSVDVSGYYAFRPIWDGFISYQTSDGFHSTYGLGKVDCGEQTIPLPVD